MLTSREVARKPVGVERLGVKVVFWRDHAGRICATGDRCPHLGASLSQGWVENDCIVCPFHGLRFSSLGRCTHAPSLGRRAVAPEELAVRSFHVREMHGLIWLWWGKDPPGSRVPPFFPGMDAGWTCHTVAVDWPVHYTRAIENQLDVSHLSFVHRTTIGSGGRSVVEGPHVEADDSGIRVWVTNKRDDDLPVRDAAQLAHAASGREPGLHLLFPGIWMLRISETFRNIIAFVPVNEHCTRYYLRSYLRTDKKRLSRPLHWVMSLSNRFILNQDRRVVITQPRGSSLASTGDHLLASDRAIIEYRRRLARQLAVQGDVQ